MAEKPRTKKKPNKESQAARFKKAARNIHADESGSRFEAAIKKIVPPRTAKVR